MTYFYDGIFLIYFEDYFYLICYLDYILGYKFLVDLGGLINVQKPL